MHGTCVTPTCMLQSASLLRNTRRNYDRTLSPHIHQFAWSFPLNGRKLTGDGRLFCTMLTNTGNTVFMQCTLTSRCQYVPSGIDTGNCCELKKESLP